MNPELQPFPISSLDNYWRPENEAFSNWIVDGLLTGLHLMPPAFADSVLVTNAKLMSMGPQVPKMASVC